MSCECEECCECCDRVVEPSFIEIELTIAGHSFLLGVEAMDRTKLPPELTKEISRFIKKSWEEYKWREENRRSIKYLKEES